MKVKEREKRNLSAGLVLLAAFVLWTIMIQYVDVQPAGPDGTEIGFGTVNVWFHQITGVHMAIYTLTDWLGLVPVFICLCFGIMGMIQSVKCRSLRNVESDIILLGVYYVLVIFCYLVFEMVPINYRPILINGVLEASYPSSTTLLVLCVMPTLKFQVDRRAGNPLFRKVTTVFVIVFSAFMVTGRLIAGVHWLSDIIGAVLLSFGLYHIYRYAAALADRKRVKPHLEVEQEWSSTKNCRNCEKADR